MADDISGYSFGDATLNVAHNYLLPAIDRILDRLGAIEHRSRLFELGCGNGSVAHYLAQRGLRVTGIDPSSDGIAQARKYYPELQLEQASAYDDLAARYGRFPIVLSLEVVEHLYAPRRYAVTLFDLLEPGGTMILSTPYHGYLKNLAIALAGRMDDHFKPLWDHGHIKFWSIRTLGTLLREVGFEEITFERVGRIPVFAKSMIALATKPF